MAVDSDLDNLDVYQRNFGVDRSVTRAVDIQKLCRRTLRAPVTDAERVLKESLGTVHVLLAGPPCQGHSDLNNSTRRNDKRNRLYLHAIRFVQLLQPDIVLIENVPTIRHDSSNVLKDALSILRSLDYFVQDPVIDISNLGLPQLRKRHVLIATKVKCAPFRIDDSISKTPISDVLEDLLDVVPSDESDISINLRSFLTKTSSGSITCFDTIYRTYPTRCVLRAIDSRRTPMCRCMDVFLGLDLPKQLPVDSAHQDKVGIFTHCAKDSLLLTKRLDCRVFLTSSSLTQSGRELNCER